MAPPSALAPSQVTWPFCLSCSPIYFYRSTPQTLGRCAQVTPTCASLPLELAPCCRILPWNRTTEVQCLWHRDPQEFVHWGLATGPNALTFLCYLFAVQVTKQELRCFLSRDFNFCIKLSVECLWLGNSAWDLFEIKFWSRHFWGFLFLPHSIIAVTWNPEYQ